MIETGVELAIQHINEAGGVNGQDVVFVTGDTQVDQTIAVKEARRLVDIEGVHAIVGPLASTISIAVAESVTGPAGVPTISPVSTSVALAHAQDSDFLFRSVISDAGQAPVLADLVSDLGVDNVGALFINDAYGQGLADAFEASFSGTATMVSHEDGQRSYLAELQQAADGGAELLLVISFPEQAKVYIRESLENGIFERFVFADAGKSQELIDDIGAEFLEGARGTAPSAGPDTNATAAWNAAYVAEFGGLPTRSFVREAYDAVIAIALAAELAGSTDGTAIRDALPKVASPPGRTILPGADGIKAGLAAVRAGTDVNYEGGATTLDWNSAGDVTSGFVGIWEFRNGEIVEVDVLPFRADRRRAHADAGEFAISSSARGSARRAAPGGTPMKRLKARLKAASDW